MESTAIRVRPAPTRELIDRDAVRPGEDVVRVSSATPPHRPPEPAASRPSSSSTPSSPPTPPSTANPSPEPSSAAVAERREELRRRLAAVRERISAAALAAGRDPAEVTVIAVTKTHPAADVRILAGLGVTDFGENRDQEASAKAAETADLDLRWHFIGRLQTNKTRSVARYASVVHSVDRFRLVPALSRSAAAAGRELVCLVQVSLDDPANGIKVVPDGDGTGACRGGIAPAEVAALADAVAEAPHLRLGGLMAVAPREGDARAAFDRLVPVAERLRRDHPDARVLSAGMSGDLEAAVAAGATHVRIGTAILGLRPPLR